MRTALCISGLPRQVEKAFPNIKANLIEPNNPDVFIHTWLDLMSMDASGYFTIVIPHKIKNLYKPLTVTFEKQLPFINSKWNLDRMMDPVVGHARSYERDKFVEMLYSSWYSVQQANLLKERYQLANNFTYDCVIRARFDINYNKPVIVADYNVDDYIHIASKGLPPEMTDDRFAFGSNRLINAYCSAFNLLDLVFKKRHLMDGVFCGETLVYEMLKMYNIQAFSIADLNCEHVHNY